MGDVYDILNTIRSELESQYDGSEEFTPGETPVRLSQPTFGADEILEAIESLLTRQVTMGEKVEQFEAAWRDHVGTERAVMTNSGSSANLVALKALEDEFGPDAEVIVPAVSWSTSVFPLLDVGATPVVVDVDPETYTMDLDAVEAAITDRTEAVLAVHVLGNPCRMDELVELCDEHDLTLVEDCCEAHGATYGGRHVGTFGAAGTFSFYFSHHISTIEGGAIVTDSERLSESAKMLRAHGWVRGVDDPGRYVGETDIDERFCFASHGYNLRPTEIQGAFGVHQVEKLDRFVETRRENAAYLDDRLRSLSDHLRFLSEPDDGRCSWFAYPLLLRSSSPYRRDDLQDHLEANGVETRPILAGNVTKHPAFGPETCRIAGDLDGADDVHANGLFVGNHHGLTTAHLDYVAETVESFFD